MAQIVGVLGSVTPPGRLLRALDWALSAGQSTGATTTLINLAEYDIGFADGRPPWEINHDTGQIVDVIQRADAVVLATPVYRGTYTGALKNLLDLVPVEGLRDKPVGIIAMGATTHHFLGVDWQLRAVLSWFGALTTPTSVYLSTADFADGRISDNAQSALAALVQSVIRLHGVAVAAGPLGPTPLAAGRG